MGVIRSTLSKNIAKKTKAMKTPKEVIDFLSENYEKPNAVEKVDMIRRLFNLKMTEIASISDHIDDYQDTIDSLSAVRIVFDDETQALIMLGSLPGSWSGTVTALSAAAGKKNLKSEDVKEVLISEETRRKKLDATSSSGAALTVTSKGKSRTNNNWKSESGKNTGGGSKSKDKEKAKEKDELMKCYKCGETGHFKRDCPMRGKNRENVVAENIEDAMFLSVSSTLELWVLDLGASFHS